jgi:hypothetical protein
MEKEREWRRKGNGKGKGREGKCDLGGPCSNKAVARQ